ncbi:MAG TPA: hypothetical protein VN934_09100 [Candidatus Tumulicola sp.]|nr:hypothetical protein [Candidatus Tumulicola sp.]
MSVADWIGLIGGIAGLLGAILSFIAYRRDAARLLIKVRRDTRMTSPGADEKVRSTLAKYGMSPPAGLDYGDSDTPWILVEAVNVGRRPIKLEKVGLVTTETPPYRNFADFLPQVLHEAQNVQQTIDQSKLATTIVRAGFVVDGAGRSHYGGFPSTWGGAVDRLRATFGFKPFTRYP